MKKKTNSKKLAVSRLLAEQGLKRESSLFILGDRELNVSGCKKVVSYSPELVRLKNCDGYLDVSGKALTVASCFGAEIKLCGVITEIKFSESDIK